MFILNGTTSFSALIATRINNAPNIELDNDSSVTMEWVLHAFKVKRKNCVIAMHTKTRYSMLFIDVKKQDSVTFFKLFFERLINEVSALCSLKNTPIESVVNAINRKHQGFVISNKSNRSVQAHINDVVWHFKHGVDTIGCLPNIHEAYDFCCCINDFLRKTVHDKDYFIPSEKMKDFWIEAFVSPCIGITSYSKNTIKAPKSAINIKDNVVLLSDYKRKNI